MNPGSTGTLPINFINGPLYANWNAGLFRNIKLGETRNLQLRMEVFNVLNRANFFLPEWRKCCEPTVKTAMSSTSTCTSFGRLTGTFDPRIVQFGARFRLLTRSLISGQLKQLGRCLLRRQRPSL